MDKQRSLDEQQAGSDPLQPARHLSAEALARRKLLLKGAGAGAAVAAGVSPTRVWAGGSLCVTQDGHRCSISGVQSAAASFAAGSSWPTGVGHSCSSYWGKSGCTWPTLSNGYTSSSSACAVFPNCGLPVNYNGKPLTLKVLASPSCSGYAAGQSWLSAYLNALACEQGYSKYGVSGNCAYPYGSSDVLNFHLQNNTSALAFFKSYLENT